MGELANIFRSAALNNLELLKKDIENCSDDVWEKKFGTDYYWHHVMHAIGSANFFLGLLGVQGLPTPPEGLQLNLYQEADAAFLHSRETALTYLAETTAFLEGYFEKLDDKLLLTPADFFGQKTTYGGILAFYAAHLAYHLGACDIVLRENGLQGAL
ncbi:MAG: DinB family protein [Deferribacteraceae bacterium]|jgi:uncharacterized damage-inducible protein DinB|nr:DinB family protein [Deferribacteraceae bacterium]